MKYFFILLTITVCEINIMAQSVAPMQETAEDSVKAVINKMFTAMKNSDTVLLKSCFADSMILQTISRTKEGLVVLTEDLATFVASISKLSRGDADERIVFETVKTDDPLAMAWTPYQFYYKGQFSHCGVNSFQLVRFNGIWKIQYIIDTRRRQGCEIK